MERKYHLRLKDLDNLCSKQVDFSIIMKEILGYRNPFILRKLVFVRFFKKAYKIVKEFEQINVKSLEINEKSPIKIPRSIDFIPFRAMMEAQALLGDAGNRESVQDLIAELISIICYKQNTGEIYDSEVQSFKDFKQRILNEPLKDMLGLYNWIDKELDESENRWEERFLSVKVEDKDYELAGGNRMSQFNIISTIKILCNDFNCSYDEAWQMSYSLVQTNSYSKATYDHIKDQMRQIKESRMQAERDRKSAR